MKRIAIDMDEVIADALSALLYAYNTEFGEELASHSFHGQELEDALLPARRGRIRDYTLMDGFFRNLDVMEGSQEVIARLNERYEVFITTAAMEFPK